MTCFGKASAIVLHESNNAYLKQRAYGTTHKSVDAIQLYRHGMLFAAVSRLASSDNG